MQIDCKHCIAWGAGRDGIAHGSDTSIRKVDRQGDRFVEVDRVQD